MSSITLVEQAAAATPNANQVVIYPKADGLIYCKDDVGTERGMADMSALQLSNLLTNPNFMFDELNPGFLYVITGGGADVQTLDGWSGSAAAAPGVFKMRRSADGDNAAVPYALSMSVGTIDATIGAADAYYIYTAVEGWYCGVALQWGTANAKSAVLSFNFIASVTGSYGVTIANAAGTRSYTTVIVVPNTSENTYNIVIPGDTTGSWSISSGVGLYVKICLAAGTNFRTAGGAWVGSNMLTTSAQVNFLSSVANTCTLKRIQLIPGNTVLPFAPIDIQKEQARCLRYYSKSYSYGVAPGFNTQLGCNIYAASGTATQNAGGVRFPASMRVAPTVLVYSTTGAQGFIRNLTSPADTGSTPTDIGTDGFYLNANGAQVDQTVYAYHWTANARIS